MSEFSIRRSLYEFGVGHQLACYAMKVQSVLDRKCLVIRDSWYDLQKSLKERKRVVINLCLNDYFY